MAIVRIRRADADQVLQRFIERFVAEFVDAHAEQFKAVEKRMPIEGRVDSNKSTGQRVHGKGGHREHLHELGGLNGFVTSRSIQVRAVELI